ncbi:MAG: DUF1439 domain-containing protein [Pseudomonadota bacterium]
MKKALVFIVMILAAAIAAWVYFADSTVRIRLTEEDIKQRLSARLPITKSHMLVFETSLDNPRVQLVEGQDRIQAGLDAKVTLRVGSSDVPMMGTIDASSGIRYASQKGAFYLTDPVVESLNIVGLPEKYTNRANGLLTRALDEYYSRWPVYTLDQKDFKQATTKLVLKDLTIKDQELVITLGL